MCGNEIALYCECKGTVTPMEKPKREITITIVNILVIVATLMILTALFVPIFIPPDGRAAKQSSSPTVTADE
jgi:hypothetical protein